METLRSLYQELQEMDRRGTISLQSIQKWVVLTTFSFFALTYMWNWRFRDDPGISHYPPSLLSPEILGKYKSHALYSSESQARAAIVREVEFAIIACSGENNNDEVAESAYRIMKSAAMSTDIIIHFHIFTEDTLYTNLIAEVDRWPLIERHHVSFQFHPAVYPEALMSWRDMYKPCSSFKLFLPTVLKEYNHVLYVDIDAVFLSPMNYLWDHLNAFNDTQTISLAPSAVEHKLEDNQCFVNSKPNRNWYKNHGKVPYYGYSGLNSGVIIFDTFKLQHSLFKIPVKLKDDCGNCNTLFDKYEYKNMTWCPLMLMTVYDLFKEDIIMPDQDILNIIFAFNPEKLFLLPFSWNYRWNFCSSYKNNSELLSDDTDCFYSHLVHCNADTYKDAKQHPEMHGLTEIFKAVRFEEKFALKDRLVKLVSNIESKLTYNNELNKLRCALRNAKIFLKTFIDTNFH